MTTKLLGKIFYLLLRGYWQEDAALWGHLQRRMPGCYSTRAVAFWEAESHVEVSNRPT